MDIQISIERYNELIAKEEKLRLLETALKNPTDIYTVRQVFGLQEEKKHDE